VELDVVFVAMDRYGREDQGHTNAAWHETAVLVEASVEGVGVVDEVVAEAVAEVAQFEVEAADDYYYCQAPVAGQTAGVEL
jgi:hypothetical protein